MENYNDRSVIGYDIREWHPLKIERGNFLITIDMQVWKDAEREYSYIELNGFNLLYSEPEFIDNGFCIVAFDIPSEIARKLSMTFGLIPLSIDKHRENKEWLFLGFDIVDIYTQSSILYSFDFSVSGKFNKIIKNKHIVLNRYGVVQEQSESIELSLMADKLIPQHAPFVPCGIWIKKYIPNPKPLPHTPS